MAKFASAVKQAASVMKLMQGNAIRSVGTVRNYEQALTRVAEYAKYEKLPGGLRGMSTAHALTYLEARGQDVGQKTLDMERQAIQSMMQHVTGKLNPGESLSVIKSEQDQVLNSRAYSSDQVDLVTKAQIGKNALATKLSYAAGLRAHELLTLRPISERKADSRPANNTKWQGREGVLYTVHGKGGLIREVNIPHELASTLETLRLKMPLSITDRKVHHTQYYDLAGGQRWSNSFSAAANRTLGWSEGAHGLRHSYAQERMHELQRQGLTRVLALETVSQEMGHFRPEITETYLR